MLHPRKWWLPPLASSGFFSATQRIAPPCGQRISRAVRTVEASSSPTPSEMQEEWDVDLYRSRHDFVWEYGSPLVDLLDPKPGERILDVGCGTGELTNRISERGAISIGIDRDQGMVARATGNFPNPRFFVADATELDVDDLVVVGGGGPVDAIFSNAALHWVKDAEAAVACMSRALKPGGRFVAEFGGKGNVREIVDASLEVVRRRRRPGAAENPWYFPSIAEYSSILERNGIEVLSAALFDRPTVLEDGQMGMKNWLEMFGIGLFKGCDSVERDELIDQIVESLRPILYDSIDGIWRADYRRIRIVGKKEH